MTSCTCDSMYHTKRFARWTDCHMHDPLRMAAITSCTKTKLLEEVQERIQVARLDPCRLALQAHVTNLTVHSQVQS